MKDHIVIISAVSLFLFSWAEETDKANDSKEKFKGLKSEVLVAPAEDCKRYSKSGDLLTVHYKGWTSKDMTLFESSYDNPNKEPETFHLGTLERIPAWDISLVDMCVGEKRKLIVPSEYGFSIYGSRNGKVGPDENLIYEIELLKIEDGPVQGPIESFNQIDQDDDGYLTMEEISQRIRQDDDEMALVEKIDAAHDALVKEIMLLEDTNADGQITWQEFSTSKYNDPLDQA